MALRREYYYPLMTVSPIPLPIFGYYNLTKYFLVSSQLKVVDELNISSNYGHVRVVQFLLRYYQSIPPTVLLIQACKNGHVKVIKLLLQAGAMDDQENTAVSDACINGHLDVVKLMSEMGYIRTMYPILYAEMGGYLRIVRFLNQHPQ
jgi:ankyrin repeat protein